MNVFIDTEFTCLPWEFTSQAVSIGIFCENGDEYYGCISDFDVTNLSQFVKDKVIPLLPAVSQRKPKEIISSEIGQFFQAKNVSRVWAVFPTLQQIQNMYDGNGDLHTIYAKYADWDFQLLKGFLSPLPNDFPTFCSDLSPYIDKLDPDRLPMNNSEHHALEDAKWNYKIWQLAQRERI